MLKKSLIAAFAIAVGISPLVPQLFADSGSFSTNMATAAWDYDYYNVERLDLNDDVSGPHQFADTVFLTQVSELCEFPELCDLVDITILKDGESLTIEGVADSIANPFWQTAQDERFIFRVPSEGDENWGTVYEYDAQTGALTELIELTRYQDLVFHDNGIAFMTFATEGERIFTSILSEEKETGDIEAQLSVFDYGSDYSRDDFSYQLTAPWQEIVDVHNGVALVRFQFEGGYDQLWLIDHTQRTMEAIPNTWTDPGAEIVAPHFLSDGTVRFFRNFRLFTYEQGVDETPQEAGGAYLNWYSEAEDNVQVAGDRIAWVDDENGLYVSDLRGTSKFGVALNAFFTLTDSTIQFQNLDGEYTGYTFDTGVWETNTYHVTDTFEDIRVGIDANGDVWYENMTNGYLMNIGFGAAPSLTDREHAYWQGTDGHVYQVTFSPLLDLERPEVEAFASYSGSTVYLVSDKQIWTVPNESVYFSWFDSWDDVLKVSDSTINIYLDGYVNGGELKFAPGTRVKGVGSSRVYVVGNDSKLHWITSETVADEIYGSDWNQGIIEVNSTYLWQYATGDNVADGDDVRSI
ncbi:MAG: hypothetical protein HQ488_01350 [Parcubacteria group bacterium]|nr:hypothetical protein [Parcubacteria group bacterium]